MTVVNLLPGPMTRLMRNRLAVVGVVMLSILASGAALMREAAAVELAQSVDSNWRGAYDLLVRPPGAQLDVERTGGLVEPNYLVFSGTGGITLADLAAIRSLPGVDVAAPVAMIGNVRYLSGGPVINGLDLPTMPTLFDVTIRVVTSNGLNDQLVQAQSGRILLGPADLASSELPFATDLGSFSWSAGGWSIILGTLPPIVSPMIAVDPAAEAQLLPGTAGFLNRLQAVTDLNEAPTAATFDLSLIPDAFDAQRSYVSVLASAPDASANSRPVIPVAVSSTVYSPLRLELQVSQVGEPLGKYPGAEDELARLSAAAAAAGPGSRDVGTVTIDVAERLRPLQPPRLGIVWPNSANPTDEVASIGSSADLSATLSGRPNYRPLPNRTGGSALAFEPEPVELVNSSGEAVSATSSAGNVEQGIETAYRASTPAHLPLLDSFRATGPLDRPFAYAPVAQFDLETLDLPDNPLNYAPLGAYAVPNMRYVADGNGDPVPPAAMTPTLNPRGLINMPPLAITDLRSAVMLRGEAPIDVIRVRIGGIDRYDERSVARVEQVASRIAAMGFHVDIVAGSSPQPIDLHLLELSASGSTEAVGWATQDWSTIGAATRIVQGLGYTNTALLFIALGAALVFSIGLQVMQASVRSRELAMLTSIGWRRRRVVGWMLGEAASAAGVVLLVGLTVWLLGGADGWLGPAITVGLAAAIPITTAVSVAWLSARGGLVRTLRSGELALGSPFSGAKVRGPKTYGLRTAVMRPVRYLAIALTLGIAAAAASVAPFVVADAARAAGPTRLAAAVLETLNPLQVAMILAIVIGTALMAFALLGMDRASRRREVLVLRASGWRRRDVRTMTGAIRLAIALPSAAVAVGLASLLNVGLISQPPWAAGSAPILVLVVLMGEAVWSSR